MARILFLFLILLFCNVTISFSKSPNLQGEMNIFIGKENTDSWYVAQKNIEKVFLGVLNDARDGKITEGVPKLGDEAINQLAAAYLFCSKRQGPCVFILDSILELDLLRSIRDGNVACDETKYFWKIWIENNYNKQVMYDLKLGLTDKFNDFNKNKIEKYLKCEDTIKQLNKVGYCPSEEKINDIKKTLKLIVLLNKKFGDISLQYNLGTTK